jgi:hypothetical protein
VPKSGGDQAAADFMIPSDAPRGDLRVASYGLVDIGPQNKTEERASAIHVRMTLTNDSDVQWTLDVREQRIELGSYGTSVSAFASADPGSEPPLVTVAPKKRRIVDLFFPLPTALQKQDELPAFETLWRVHTGETIAEGRASFDKIAVRPPAVAAAYDYGPDYYWGPPYWYNPYYVDYGFVGGFVFSPFYFGYPLWVHHHDHYGHFYGGYGHGGYYGHGYYGHGGPYYGAHPGVYPHGRYPYGVYPHGARPNATYPHYGPPGGHSTHGAYPQYHPRYQQTRPSYHPPSGGGRGVYHGTPSGVHGGGHGGGGRGGGGHR